MNTNDSLFPCARASVKTSEFYVPTRTCTASGSFVRRRHLAPLRTTVDHWSSHSCFTFVRNLQSVFHLRLCVPSWICGLSSCRHLLGFVQLLPVSFHSVLMYLSRLLIVEVANELATLGCVPLAVSASQERKQRGTVFFRDTVGVHLHLAAVRTGSVLQEAVSVHIPGQRSSA